MRKTGQIPSGFIWSHLEYEILINYSIINEWNFSNATSASRDPLYHIEDWAKVTEEWKQLLPTLLKMGLFSMEFLW